MRHLQHDLTPKAEHTLGDLCQIVEGTESDKSVFDGRSFGNLGRLSYRRVAKEGVRIGEVDNIFDVLHNHRNDMKINQYGSGK